jgi:hypothetical protein
MKNLLQITSAGEDLLGTVDDGTNRLFINDTEVPSSQWTGTGSYTGSFSGHTITIAKIADTSGNVAIRKTGTYTYELYDQNESGYLITNTLPTISVPNNSITVLGTQTLGAGNWLVIGSINWAVNGSGYRQVAFANGANPSRMDFVTAAPANASGKQSAQQIVKIFASDNEQTVTLYGLQNSGSALTVYPYIQAINLG